MAKKPEDRQKQLQDLAREVKKNTDTLSDVDKSFSSFGDDFKVYVNQAQNITNGLKDFVSMRQESLAGFGKELTASFRATQKWADRIKFDIASFADDNIRDVNEGIKAFEDMQSETGKEFEKRMGGLMHGLRDADQGEAIAILNQIHAMREEAHKSLSEEEAARLDFMAKTAQRGLESIGSASSVLKGAIMETLPSLESFVGEKLLGGGILGKFAGTMIRKRRQAKEAQAQAAGLAEGGFQQDIATGAGLEQQEIGRDLAGKFATQEVAFKAGFDAMVSELRMQTDSFRQLVGLQQKSTDAVLDQKEESAEADRTAERRHDEQLAAMGEGGPAADGDDKCPRIPGGFMEAVLGALSGKWIAQAASFLMTPLKKVVGAVAGGIGKAVGFIMPKKWSAGLSKFFKKTDKDQAASLAKADKGTNFLTKITDKLKGIIKSITDTIKTVFKSIKDVIKGIVDTIGKVLKSIGDVINSVMKSLANILKTIGKGIAEFMKQLARGIGYFGNKKVLMGALSLVAIAAGVFVFAKALKEFAGIDFKQVLLGGIAMVGFGLAALVLGKLAPHILMGALAIAVLGVAIMPFAHAMSFFAGVPWKDVFIGLGALAAFAALAAILGMVAPLIFIGSLAIAALGFALFPAAMAMIMFGAAAVIFGFGLGLVGKAIALIVGVVGDFLTTIVDNFIRLGEVGGAGMISAAVGILALAGALIAFTAAGAAAQLLATASSVAASAMSFLFGTPAPGPFEMLQMFIAFGEVAPMMGEGAKGIDELTGAIQRFGDADFDTESVAETIGLVAGLGGAIKAFMGNEPGLLGGIGDLLGGVFSSVGGFFSGLFGIKKPKKTPLEILESIGRIAPRIAQAGKGLDKFAMGLGKVLEFQGSKWPSEFFDDMEKAFKQIPTTLINEKATTVRRFADAISELTTELKELNSVADNGISMRMLAAQQMNGELTAANADMSHVFAQPAPSNISNRTNNIVTNDSTHFHMPINPRNNEASLNRLLARRR